MVEHALRLLGVRVQEAQGHLYAVLDLPDSALVLRPFPDQRIADFLQEVLSHFRPREELQLLLAVELFLPLRLLYDDG